MGYQLTQKTRDVDPMLVQCWANVTGDGLIFLAVAAARLGRGFWESKRLIGRNHAINQSHGWILTRNIFQEFWNKLPLS